MAQEEPRYRIPDDEVVLRALERVLATKRTVESQRQLKQLVERELRGKENYRIGERRLRMLALESGRVRLEPLYRETAGRRTVRRCPVCGEKTERVRNRTVYGGTVTTGFRCSHCGYWTGLHPRVPTRYVFTRK